MKAMFGVASLLLALAATGLLIRQQLSAVKQSAAPLGLTVLPGTDGAANAAAPTLKDLPQQYKQALESAIQPLRALPDDKQ